MAVKSSSGAANAFGLFLLRLMVGWAFLSEGIEMVLHPAALGAAKIGIPASHLLGLLVGIVEIVCGAMLILGLATLYAIIPLLVVIGTTVAVTKIPLFYKQRFWAAVHESRTDLCMLLGLIAVACLGAGGFAVDRWRGR
jgi:putative oxidoreductase